MKEVTQWWAEMERDYRTWLILGKGPSFERRQDFDLARFRTVGLNHVVRRISVEVSSVIDLDVLAECGHDIYRNAQVLLMPRYPHVNFEASDQPLEHFFNRYPVLGELNQEDRLVWYNYISGKAVDDSPQIPGGYFSAEVIVNLLAVLGARSIRTLGVDGGRAYSSGFDSRTKLANKQSSFDMQWAGITYTVRRYGIDYAPLTTEVPIRVFIAGDESRRLAARVLEYSLKKHCPLPVVCSSVNENTVRGAKRRKDPGWSEVCLDRFVIPELAGLRGRAVYLEADMLALHNIQALWEIPFEGAAVLYAPSVPSRRTGRFSVMLLNCDELKWDSREIVKALDRSARDESQSHHELCIEARQMVQPRIPREWNSSQKDEQCTAAMIHYTDKDQQPWVSCTNRSGDIWVEHLKEAVKKGFISLTEVEEAIAKGFARPSLRRQIKLSRRRWRVFSMYVGPIRDMAYRRRQKVEPMG
jgi:hypothetical protein